MSRLRPWKDAADMAWRDAHAAERETALVRARRPMVERILIELGLHAEKNNVIGMLQSVARGTR